MKKLFILLSLSVVIFSCQKVNESPVPQSSSQTKAELIEEVQRVSGKILQTSVETFDSLDSLEKEKYLEELNQIMSAQDSSRQEYLIKKLGFETVEDFNKVVREFRKAVESLHQQSPDITEEEFKATYIKNFEAEYKARLAATSCLNCDAEFIRCNAQVSANHAWELFLCGFNPFTAPWCIANSIAKSLIGHGDCKYMHSKCMNNCLS